MRMKTIAGILLALAALVAPMSSAQAQEPFYKGKRLTVMINYGAGGPSDVEGRVFARHIGRLIEGNPSIIVQNIDGAGGLTGTTWLGEIAPKDGTAMGHLTGIAWRYANDPGHFRVDFQTYEFVGYQGSTTIYYVRTDVEPGIRTAADLVKAKGLVSGGLAPDSSKDLSIRLGLELLGLQHKHVTSYRSSAHARLALQQGEINFFGESPPTYQQRRQSATRQRRNRDSNLARSRRRSHDGGEAGRGPQYSAVPRILPFGQRRAAVRPVVGCLQHRANGWRLDAAGARAAARSTARCGRGAACGTDANEHRSDLCRRCDEGAWLCVGIHHRPEHQPGGASESCGLAADARISRGLFEAAQR